jgi:RimJ/RimL family protein N-acetyltransferase
MGFIIRETTKSDAYDVATVHVRSWQSAYRNIIPDSFLDGMNIEKQAERFTNDINEYRGKTFYYVAENDGRIIGNLVLSGCRDDDKGDAGEVIAMYLHPEQWDKGFGRQMMEYAVAELESLGYKEIVIWVLEENHRARKFYEKCGFTPDGTKKELCIDKPLVVVRYVNRVEVES